MPEITDFILLFGGIVSSFGVFDVLADQKHKRIIAEYLFGFHGHSVNQFELSLSKAVVGWFSSGHRVSLFRIFVFSLLFSPVIFYLSIFFGYFTIGPDESFAFHLWYRWQTYLPFYIFSLFLSCVFDYWSLRVARYIYFEREISSAALRIALDLVLSILPFCIVCGAAFLVIYIYPAGHDFPFVAMIVAVGVLLSLAVVFIVKIFALLVGVLLRLLIMITHLNRHTILVSNAHNFPFTFIGFLIALVVCFSSAA